MQPGEWTISGLPVLITDRSKVDDNVHIGDYVRGAVRAPGDGTLVVLELKLDRPDQARLSSFAVSATAYRRPWRRVDQVYADAFTQPHPDGCRAAAPLSDRLGAQRRARHAQHADAAALETETPAASETPTFTPQPTNTPMPTLTPLRTVTYGGIKDVVRAINGSRWTIGPWVVETNGDTQYVNSPGVGDMVDCRVAFMPDGSTVAVSIRALRSAPVTFDLTGIVNSMGTNWNVDGTIFTIGGDTSIDGGIQIGDYATVQAEKRSNGENHALRIIRLVRGDDGIQRADWVFRRWPLGHHGQVPEY